MSMKNIGLFLRRRGTARRARGGKWRGGASRGDHDICLVAGVVEIVELDRLTVELLRQSDARS